MFWIFFIAGMWEAIFSNFCITSEQSKIFWCGFRWRLRKFVYLLLPYRTHHEHPRGGQKIPKGKGTAGLLEAIFLNFCNFRTKQEYFDAVFADGCENLSIFCCRKEHTSSTLGAVRKRQNVKDPLCGPLGENNIFLDPLCRPVVVKGLTHLKHQTGSHIFTVLFLSSSWNCA